MELLASITAKIGNRNYKTECSNGNHHWLADEPLEIGGTDQGPNPYEILLSALSACSSITMKMYADRKEWPMEGSEIVCELVKETPESPYHIRRKITLLGPLEPEQKERLIQIANICPVHKMVSQMTAVETTAG